MLYFFVFRAICLYGNKFRRDKVKDYSDAYWEGPLLLGLYFEMSEHNNTVQPYNLYTVLLQSQNKVPYGTVLYGVSFARPQCLRITKYRREQKVAHDVSGRRRSAAFI